MADLPISDEAVEMAARVIHGELDSVDLLDEVDEDVSVEIANESARAAIQAFLAAEGFEVEREAHPSSPLWKPEEKTEAHRLVSPWRPDV